MTALPLIRADAEDRPEPRWHSLEVDVFVYANDDEAPFVNRKDVNPIPASVYPIWRLNGRELNRPIVVTIESDEDDVVINSPRLRIWGVGSDKYEALLDFSLAFEAVLQSYCETPQGQLTDDAVRLRDELKAFVE